MQSAKVTDKKTGRNRWTDRYRHIDHRVNCRILRSQIDRQAGTGRQTEM